MQAFYCCYSTEEQVPANAPVPVTRDESVALAQRVLLGRDDFLGFVDNADRTVQMILEVNGGVVLDVPVPDLSGSYTKVIAREALADFIRHLPTDFSQLEMGDFAFAKW